MSSNYNNDLCAYKKYLDYLSSLTPLDKIKSDYLEGLEDWLRGPKRHQPRQEQVNTNAMVDLNAAFLSAEPRRQGLDTTCNRTISNLNALDNALLEVPKPMEVDEVEPAAASRT